MKQIMKYVLTGIIVLAAVGGLLYKYRSYVSNPWTRDGQVRASVVQITSRVSGPIVNLPIKDNQFVRAGDLLFEIDPRTYATALAQAKAQLEVSGNNYQALSEQVVSAQASVDMARHSITQAKASIKEIDAQIARNKAEVDRQTALLPQKATSTKSVQRAQATYDVSLEQRKAANASLAQAQASHSQAKANLAKARANLGAAGDANPQVRTAMAAVRQAELNLEFTRVTAPVDGYVTNLQLRTGSQAVANQPALALVDVNSYWVHGFFKETSIADIQPGDRAFITLMAYPDETIQGRVDSLGWGIAQQDGSTGFQLLPNVSPTFEWIRLAQRIPVRIHLKSIPEHIKLRVGMTCSALVMTAKGGSHYAGSIPPAPGALQ